MKPALESEEQKAFCQYLDFMNLAYYSIPNENITSGIIRKLLIGMLGQAKGMKIASRIISSIENKLKAMGKKKGMLDIVVLLEGGKSLYVEMKRTKGSTTSKEQLVWIDTLNNLGHHAKVCKGAKEAIEFVEKYLPEGKKKINVK